MMAKYNSESSHLFENTLVPMCNTELSGNEIDYNAYCLVTLIHCKVFHKRRQTKNEKYYHDCWRTVVLTLSYKPLYSGMCYVSHCTILITLSLATLTFSRVSSSGMASGVCLLISLLHAVQKLAFSM